MADNSLRTPGSGETIRTVDKSGGTFKVQTVQLDFGTGTAESLVNTASPLPVADYDTAQTAQSIAATSGNAVTVSALQGVSGVAVQITGTWTGTVTFEGSVDGTNFFTISMFVYTGSTGVPVTTATANGQWQGDIAGCTSFRVRCSVTGTGTIVVSIRATDGTGFVGLETPIPAGTNIIGALSANQSVNVAQINGVAATMGNGVAGTGVQRVTLASDSTGVLAGVTTVATVTNVATIGTSITPGTGAANLGKAEDAVAASGDTGVMALAVRTDTPATTANASGDYHPLEVDANGALWTHPIQSSFRIEVDSAGLTTATTAYTSGDHAGTVNTFANAARVTGWGGIITGAALVDKSLKVSTIAVELWLFQSQPASPGADNAALTFADTDMSNFVGIITFDSGSWKATALNAVNHQANLSMGYTCAATSLFGYYVVRGVPSGSWFSAVTDLRVSLQMLRD